MKKIFITICFLALIVPSYSQNNHHSQPLTYEDYMKKSKSQKDVGTAMIIGGMLFACIGTLAVSIGGYGENINLIPPAIGLGTALCSIPFFISSGKNKRRAVSISLENQPVSFYWQNSGNLNTQPALSLKIRL